MLELSTHFSTDGEDEGRGIDQSCVFNMWWWCRGGVVVSASPAHQKKRFLVRFHTPVVSFQTTWTGINPGLNKNGIPGIFLGKQVLVCLAHMMQWARNVTTLTLP